jgi:hypothetical protein
LKRHVEVFSAQRLELRQRPAVRKQHELVPTDSRHHIIASGDGGETLRHGDECNIAEGMA